MRRPLPYFIILLVIFSMRTSLFAQESGDAVMRSYYASLPQLSVQDLQSETSSKDRLRRAYAALELHLRSGNEPDAARAVRYFSDVVKSDSLSPWSHYGFALALARVRSKNAVFRVLNLSNGQALQSMDHELRRALELDPNFNEARELHASITERMRDANSVVPARLIENFESTAEESATDRLARAITLFRAGRDADGAKIYFAGIAHWDSAGADAYADDLELIATSQEMITVTDGSLEKRANALRTFWRKRGVRDGITEGQRIGEHYRRLYNALTKYRPPFSTVAGTNIFGKKRTGLERAFDDRGLIYVRYGEPLETVGTLGRYSRNSSPLEAWAYYDKEGKYRVYFFSNGMQIVDPLKHLPAEQRAEMTGFLSRYDARYAFVGARLETVRLYNFMPIDERDPKGMTYRQRDAKIADLREDMVRQNDRIVEKNFKMAFAAYDADAATPRYTRPLPVFHDFATFRGKGCTDLVYSVVAPVPSYRLNVAVADTFTWEAQTIDTTVTARDYAGGFLRSTGIFCTQPDYNAYVSFSVSTDTSGAAAGGEVRVPDYSGNSLMMSDLLFASTRPGNFVRGAAQLAIVPPRQFREEEPFRVFYELYNLPRGRSYKTEITLTTVEPNILLRVIKGKSTTTLSFDDVANTDGVVQELRTLVPQVQPGEVKITIKVTDKVTGESATNSEKIYITPKN